MEWLSDCPGSRAYRRLRCRKYGDRNDRSDTGLFDLYLIQTVKFIELADFYFLLLVRGMVVYKNHFLIDCNLAVIYFTDADTADIFVIVDRADEHLSRGIRIFPAPGYNPRSSRKEVPCFFLHRSDQNGNTGFCGCVDKRTVKLFI